MHKKTERMCFEGTNVRFRMYTPDREVTCRAAFVSSPIGDCESWDALCEKLADKGCLCVCFEMPGYGRSPVNAPQDNATRAALMWGVLDEVEYSRGESGCSWHLISHGSGCGVIMKMAQDYGENVLSRVLISPVTSASARRVPGFMRHLKPGKWLLRKFYNFSTSSPKRFGDRMEKLYGMSLSQKRLDMLSREFIRGNRFETLLNTLENGYRISAKAYKAVSPVMLIWGRGDVFGTGPDEKLLKKLQNVEVHYLTSSHMCMETMPQEISEYLNGWFTFTAGRQKPPANGKKAK